MADSEIEITPGSGAKVDTRVVDTDQHRQVVVIGDPSNVASVASIEDNNKLAVAVMGVGTDESPRIEAFHADAISGTWPNTSMLVSSLTRVFNGSTWDRLRGNTNGLFAQIRGPSGDIASVTSNGRLLMSGSLGDIQTSVDGAANTDGLWVQGAGTSTGQLETRVVVFNGTSWDRLRAIGGLPAADANTGIQAVAKVPHKTGYAAASITARYTTTQTSTILGPTVGASQKMVVTSIQIQTSGTTAGDVVVYFGTGAYTRGTNRAVFDGHFIPSATNAPGYTAQPNVPYEGPANGSLRVTTSAAINPLTITAWYYLVAV